MRTCSPSEFLRRWPGSLRPVALPEPPPAIPDDGRNLLTEFGLPRTLTIACYNDIRLTFSGTVTPLAAIWDRDLQRGSSGLGKMPGEWARFWHIADQEYLQGGGWICIEESSGQLIVLDLDLPDPVYSLNSSLRNFYTTLAHFLEWSERTGGSPAATAQLRDTLRQQDVIPPNELECFWMNIIDATLDGDPVNLTVTIDPRTG
jgi:hypothetical protein